MENNFMPLFAQGLGSFLAYMLLIALVLSTALLVRVKFKLKPANHRTSGCHKSHCKTSCKRKAALPKPVANSFSFCPFCTSKLELALVEEDMKRLKCTNSSCTFVHWDNPKFVSICIIPYRNPTNNELGLILVERGVEPKIGYQALPGGFVNSFELPEQAAIREAFQETGIAIEINSWFDTLAVPGRNEILLVYLAKEVNQEPKAGSDARRVIIHPVDEIPALLLSSGKIAFDLHKQIITKWLEERKGQ
jgi:ADP-ribose pyrophosphatase YjhB (NUDIX family)